jgi:hypothetical protein
MMNKVNFIHFQVLSDAEGKPTRCFGLDAAGRLWTTLWGRELDWVLAGMPQQEKVPASDYEALLARQEQLRQEGGKDGAD